MKLKIFTDGAARGNPGHAGAGILILNENDEVIEEFFEYLGTATNNVAEYHALIAALKLAQKYIPCSIDFFLDSELVVKQMLGLYKVKNENLLNYYTSAKNLLINFQKINFKYIPREKNVRADKLANKAIDDQLKISC